MGPLHSDTTPLRRSKYRGIGGGLGAFCSEINKHKEWIFGSILYNENCNFDVAKRMSASIKSLESVC